MGTNRVNAGYLYSSKLHPVAHKELHTQLTCLVKTKLSTTGEITSVHCWDVMYKQNTLVNPHCHTLHFTQKFKMAKISLSLTVSEINMFLHVTQKFKMATKLVGKQFLRKIGSRPQIPCGPCQNSRIVKTIFRKNCQYTLQIPCGSKILSKSLYLSEINTFYTEILDGRQKWWEKYF